MFNKIQGKCELMSNQRQKLKKQHLLKQKHMHSNCTLPPPTQTLILPDSVVMHVHTQIESVLHIWWTTTQASASAIYGNGAAQSTWGC